MNRIITVGNIKPNRYGYVVGVKKDDGTWVNLFLNDKSLAHLFEVGKQVEVELAKTASGNLVIKGAAPVKQAGSNARDPETAVSIEKQTAMKAWAEVQHGNHKLTPEEFGAGVLKVWETVFRGAGLVKEAMEALDAKPEGGESDDGIPF